MWIHCYISLSRGFFFILANSTRDEVVVVLVNELGITHAKVEDEARLCNGSYARYTWLEKLVENMVTYKRTKTTARAFLL